MDTPLDLGPGGPVSPRAAVDAALDALLARLDEHQRALVEAVVDGTGNVQSSAAAGSGKTTAMVAAIGALVRSGVPASSVVATTFTSKAGKELQERLAAVVHPGDLASLRVGTFHGLALRGLRAAGTPGFGSMDRCMDIDRRAEGVPASRQLWSRVLGWSEVPELGNRKGLDVPLAELGISAGDYALAADVIRSRNIDIGSREALAAADEIRLPQFRRAWTMYEEGKVGAECWDFADALAAYRDGLAAGAIRDRAGIVVVDETQDNSEVQTTIAALLARDGGRLVVIGDEKQAIYSWRGASPGFFLGFREKFSATSRELVKNYRSARRIVAVGNGIARGKSWSLGGDAVAARSDEGTVDVAGGFETPFEEAEAVAHRVRSAMEEGARADAFAVLARTNATLGAYEAAFMRARLPCVVLGGTSFFKRREVLDVVAYCALAQHDSVTQLDRVHNRPKRFLGKVFMDAVRREPPGDLVATIRRVAPALRSPRGALDLAADIERIRAAGWPGCTRLVQGLLTPPEKDDDKGPAGEADNDSRGMTVAACGIAETFGSARELVEFALLCGASIEGVGESADVRRASAGKVVLCTAYRAKGLEWPRVFVSASEGVFPHRRSILAATRGDSSRMEEEERLFYVACTRARDALTLTWSGEDIYGRPSSASRFLAYAEPHRTDLAEGDGAPCAGGDETPPRAEAEAEAEEDAASPPPPRWDEARRVAEARTAEEPRAAPGGGEGSRSVVVEASALAEILAPLGFAECDGTTGQRTWRAPVPGRAHVEIVVYSGIAAGTERGAAAGEDSIRVAAVLDTGRAAAGKLPLVARTRGWRVAVLDRVERVVLDLGSTPPCTRCGGPTAVRTSPRGPFHGCRRFPACAGTA